MSQIQSRMMEAIRLTKPPKIVRNVGDLNKVVADGITYTRQQQIHIPDMGTFACAPYDNHFVYRDRTNRIGWKLFCTCGGAAVVAGYEAYKKDASAQGQMILCLQHANTGRHADGSS